MVAVLALKFVEVNVNNTNPNSVYVKAPIIAIALLSIPIFDTLRVFGLRILRGKSPFKADRLHFHHLLIDLGLKHHYASAILFSFTIVFTSVIYFIRNKFSNTNLSIGLLTIFIIYLVIGFYLERKRLKTYKNKLLSDQKTKQKAERLPAPTVVKSNIVNN